MKKRRKTRKNKGIAVATAVIFAVGFVLIYADYCMRPVVVTVAQYRIQSLITKAVNSAILQVMDETDVSYTDLVDVRKNTANEIVSINYNSMQINKLRSRLVHASMEQTQKIPATSIYIPIGNMTNFDILQNKGPKLRFTITPSSYVEADVESVFQHTGINQINHQIFITITVTANALVPNYSTSVECTSKVCVAETVIIGKVPESIGNSVLYADE